MNVDYQEIASLINDSVVFMCFWSTLSILFLKSVALTPSNLLVLRIIYDKNLEKFEECSGIYK